MSPWYKNIFSSKGNHSTSATSADTTSKAKKEKRKSKAVSPTDVSKVDLAKKSNPYCKKGTNEIDFDRLALHIHQLHYKIERNFVAHKTKTGKDHPLKSKSVAHDYHAVKPEVKITAANGVDTTAAAASGSGTGSDPLVDESEELWHGAITLGGQTIQVDFDTGSSDIILNKSAYTPGSTATDTGHTFKTAYGDGTTASGKVYTDTLEIAGLKAPNAAIGLASTDYLSTSENDQGIAGMAYPSLAQLQEPPFFDSLMSAGVLNESVFTFTLTDTGSALFLGGIPSGVTNVQYSPVDSSQGFWGVTASINGSSTAGIIDTGTTLIVAPTSYAKALFKKLGLQTTTQSGSIYALYDTSAPPTITIDIGSFSQQLSPATLSIGTQNGKETLSIIGSDIGSDFVIFGDSFLRNVVVVFDRQNNQVGFASQ